MLSIRTGQVSITGNFRENNEDNLVVDEHQRFVIVADGMGGQSAGEKASELAVELIPQKLLQLLDFDSDSGPTVVDAIDKSIHFANSEIMALSEVNPSYRNMGTKVVFLVRAGGKLYIGGIGDSRAYQLGNGVLKQLTTDHSLTQALIEAGTISQDEAKTHRYRNVLYRYLGTRDGSTGTNAAEIAPAPGDRFLLCSDGVTDGICDEKIASLMVASDDPQHIAETIVTAAQEGGSRDNITCVVVIAE